MKDDNIVDWFSLENGEHVPLREGESKREALRNYLNKKMSRVEKNKDKYEKISEFKKKKRSNNKIEEEIEYLDLDEDFNSKFETNKDKTKYTLKPEIKKKYERELKLTKNGMKDFNVNADGTKYTMKQEKEEEIRKKLKSKDK